MDPQPVAQPGDLIWVKWAGEGGAKPGVLIGWLPEGRAKVQLMEEPAGVHQVVPAENVMQRKGILADDQPPPRASELANDKDPYGQLIALFPRVVDALEPDVRRTDQRKALRKRQLRLLGRAYVILTEQQPAPRARKPWSQDARDRQSQRMRDRGRHAPVANQV